MAEEDIYHNKRNYDRFIANLEQLKGIPKEKSIRGRIRKYYCKNPINIAYFSKFIKRFETNDTSYIRRLRLFRVLLIITNVTKKDLCECNREDIDTIIAFSHTVNKSIKSKKDFIKDLKHIWKCLFPEKDEKGRIDETLMPYVVRHISSKIDKSREKLRDDRLSLDEVERLMNYFSNNPQMQFYLSLSLESLGRPQEICYRKIKDLEIYEDYAKLYVSSHGKEGTKFLQIIDSYPYFLKWFEIHPYKNDKNAFLFLSNGKDRQLTPLNINKKLRLACKKLGIDKRITAYSLKRNGITFSRLRGDSDVEIQHRAGWSSTKQIKTYDLSNNEDYFKKELAKRGLIKDDTYKEFLPKTKQCICGAITGFADKMCNKCKRIIDKDEIKRKIEVEKEIMKVIEIMKDRYPNEFKDVMKEVL